MNRTIKEATVNRYSYQTRQKLQDHLNVFIYAYNFAKRLKTIHGLTPYELIVKSWSQSPDLFRFDPSFLNLGLYI